MLSHISKADKDGNVTSFTVYIDGHMYPFDSTSPFFKNIIQAVQNDDQDAVRKYVDFKKSIGSFSDGKIQLFENSLFFNGKEVSNSLVTRIIKLYKMGFDCKPMITFLENLMLNPAQSAIDELYGFLEACTLPITDDGHFLAYKMINNDYTDKRTGTMDNSVGAVVKMARTDVDGDRYTTCSSGLHFCSLEYVTSGFGSPGVDRLVVVKINPRDVVSIPVDYNNSKGRACEYSILKEIEFGGRIADFFEKVTDSPVDDIPDDNGDDTPAVVADTKLDDAAVKLMKRDFASKAFKNGDLTLTAIAKAYNVSRRHAARVRDGEVWAWVKAAR